MAVIHVAWLATAFLVGVTAGLLTALVIDLTLLWFERRCDDGWREACELFPEQGEGEA